VDLLETIKKCEKRVIFGNVSTDITSIFLKHFFIAYRFYFPNGNPTGKQSQETLLKKLSEAFAKYKNNSVRLEELGQVLKVTSSFYAFIQASVMMGPPEKDI
jgi:hypothetical protein